MVTRGKSTAAARSAVLDTAELLAAILSDLPVNDLIKVRLVSRQWESMIAAFPALQRKLFLRKHKFTSTWVLDNRTKVLKKFDPIKDSQRGKEWFDRQGRCDPAIVNTLLFARDPACTSGKRKLSSRFPNAETLTFIRRPRMHLDLQNDKGLFFDKMFLTQPPATDMVIRFNYYDRKPKCIGYRGPNREIKLSIENEEGVTWADVVTAFQNTVGPGARDVYVRTAKCKIWAVGVVFYTQQEYLAVESGVDAQMGQDGAANAN